MFQRGLLASVLFGLLATAAFADIVVRVEPPRPRYEHRVPPPGPGYVWTPGYHRWDGRAYVWVPGAWVLPPRHHAHWVPAHWVHRHHEWYFVEGHWR
jgi:WXXGXW repeat (2 copies)